MALDARWWLWIGVALFVGIAGYIWLSHLGSSQLEPTVLSLENIPESRLLLARTSAGMIEYRRIPIKLSPYFRERSHEFSYVLGGRAVGFIKNQDVDVHKDFLLIIPRRTAVGLRVTSVEPLEILSFYAPAPDALDEVQVFIGDTLPPGDPSSLQPIPLPIHESDIKPQVINLVTLENKELPKGSSAFEWGYLARSDVGSVALVRVTERVALRERSVHFLYIRQGQARITVGEKVLEATANQVVILPNAAVRTIERLGTERLELLLLSAPALRERDFLLP
jgi:mannose-6-phosphate isomerase-like protein (cupin superfamily)